MNLGDFENNNVNSIKDKIQSEKMLQKIEKHKLNNDYESFLRNENEHFRNNHKNKNLIGRIVESFTAFITSLFDSEDDRYKILKLYLNTLGIMFIPILFMFTWVLLSESYLEKNTKYVDLKIGMQLQGDRNGIKAFKFNDNYLVYVLKLEEVGDYHSFSGKNGHYRAYRVPNNTVARQKDEYVVLYDKRDNFITFNSGWVGIQFKDSNIITNKNNIVNYTASYYTDFSESVKANKSIIIEREFVENLPNNNGVINGNKYLKWAFLLHRNPHHYNKNRRTHIPLYNNLRVDNALVSDDLRIDYITQLIALKYAYKGVNLDEQEFWSDDSTEFWKDYFLNAFGKGRFRYLMNYTLISSFVNVKYERETPITLHNAYNEYYYLSKFPINNFYYDNPDSKYTLGDLKKTRDVVDVEYVHEINKYANFYKK